ncbi:MAG: sigma-70 family RNA polymerase sigma factor [Planctomycetia bacterium]|nr:sigma-70 family RNA polymerase sigma factor [Planctomycetia bacterium]
MAAGPPGSGEPEGAGAERATSLTLLQRVRANDRAAWQRLVQLYTPLVYYWCNRWGCSAENRDDVVQEVFLAVATGLPRFHRDRPGDSFRGWLRGITRNTLLAYLRRNRRQPSADGGTHHHLQMQAVSDQSSADDDDPPAELQSLHRRALELVRGEFEDRTWQMFWRTVVEGQSPVDVAADLGVSPAAVRMAKSRVLRRLKDELGDLLA